MSVGFSLLMMLFKFVSLMTYFIWFCCQFLREVC